MSKLAKNKLGGSNPSIFGYRYIKFEPNDYIIQYVKGKVKREGEGLAFWYYGPSTSIVKVPTTVLEEAYMFEQITQDYQSVTIQGSVSYKIREPKKIASHINYTISSDGRSYVVGEQVILANKIKNAIVVSANNVISSMDLRQAITNRDDIKNKIIQDLEKNTELVEIGAEILNLSLLAVKPSMETARALEAKVREQILKDSDDAVYVRRNASIEQERLVKENEYNTEIAIEEKKIEIEDKKLEARRKHQEKQNQLRMEQVYADIDLEQARRKLMEITSDNVKMQADAKAYELSALMNAIKGINPETMEVLAGLDRNSGQLIANAFRELAKKAGQIGQLNVSPDLLRELMD